MDSRPASMLVGLAEMTAWRGGVCVHGRNNDDGGDEPAAIQQEAEPPHITPLMTVRVPIVWVSRLG